VLLQATTKIAQVQVPHLPRRDSVSNYSFRKLFALWLNGFIGFSVRPLRVASLIGVLVFLISAISSIVLLTRKIVHPEVIMSGWTSLMLVLLALFGLQFLLLGVIGEYIGRVLLFLNGKPQYVVRRTHASDVNRKEAREARQ